MYYQMYCPFEEKFEDTKGLIRDRKSKNEDNTVARRTDKMTNNSLQSTAHKTNNSITCLEQLTAVFINRFAVY